MSVAMIFNPFKCVFTTRYSPSSEMLRHNFLDKIVDTFQVLFGKFTNLDPSSTFNLGILDYLSLGSLTLPLLFWRWAVTEKSNNRLAQVLFPFACILMAPIVLVRAIISGICLFLSLPIIAIVHGITLLFSKPLFVKELSLEVNDCKTGDTVTLGKALGNVFPKQTKYISEEIFREDIVGVNSISDKTYHYVYAHYDELFTLPQKLPTEPSQRTAMQALLRLNLFHYTEACEKFHDPMVEQSTDASSSPTIS